MFLTSFSYSIDACEYPMNSIILYENSVYYNLDKKSLSSISTDSKSYINNNYNKKIMVQKHSNYFKNSCYKNN